eukprot:6182431-Pleurochrysis_carterae.AAC.1
MKSLFCEARTVPLLAGEHWPSSLENDLLLGAVAIIHATPGCDSQPSNTQAHSVTDKLLEMIGLAASWRISIYCRKCTPIESLKRNSDGRSWKQAVSTWSPAVNMDTQDSRNSNGCAQVLDDPI